MLRSAVSGSADFKPVSIHHRSYGTWDLAALWIGLVVSNTTWFLAGGLVEMGAAFCIFVSVVRSQDLAKPTATH